MNEQQLPEVVYKPKSFMGNTVRDFRPKVVGPVEGATFPEFDEIKDQEPVDPPVVSPKEDATGSVDSDGSESSLTSNPEVQNSEPPSQSPSVESPPVPKAPSAPAVPAVPTASAKRIS